MNILFLKHVDRALIVGIFFLLGVSLLTLWGAALRDADYTLFTRQALWMGVGILVFILVASVDYRLLRGARRLILWLYLAGGLLLVSVLIFGTEIRGSRSWFRIGWLSFEPVEMVKIISIMVFAQYFSLRHIESYRIKHILISGVYALTYVALVFLQPDVGSAIILLGIWVGVVVISGIQPRQLLSIIGIAAVLFALGWNFYFADYQKARIIAFLQPEYDPQGVGYNVRQALVAIANGGLLGQGIGEGSQVQLHFLPESETDFIFGAIGESFGFVGLFLTLVSIGYILFWLFLTAQNSRNNFARLTSMGLFFLIFIQSGIHISMNLGIFPVTGVPLPLVSYGGSSLLSTFFALGLAQSIAIRNRLGYPREPVELG